ncbi:MAG: hypothetical protein GTO45_05320 [Candidatus Aminicenantes bacterium]|nr:hypothetical protein [Candidatus Aminicenantes bacterium]NIM78169.1 hypothetical protein [Candidatus Aminicenantes bacterium]NIN17505.1 hypothetical protein [Candidatus Aminicenantes bacterium]NIN41391.1 hypothetical protein [Candidatus Aminicenantes bacterium]NIN84157.1 hypothetical protein [Candidatus Aminicenantes bacterium]
MVKLSGTTVFILLLILVFAANGFPDEGMWMPHQMKELDLAARGLKMDPGGLYKTDGTGLMSAVVYLGGGTAAFVSAEGLILTNHHVAFGAIQRASDKEHDYITHGFLAKTKAEEIPARGYIADVLLGYEDVTAEFLKRLKPSMSPEKRYKTIDRLKKRLIARAEKKSKDTRCYLKPMYSGNRYYLFKFKRLRDIRVVYAPPQSIGNYGGDIDNWMWPRHTCDFSFLRAYVSRDNVGAAYSSDNVPYHPTSFFKISLEGVKPGDFTFVMGYPGRTNRNDTSAELQADIDDMRQRIELYRDLIRFYEKAGENNRGVQIKYASLIKGLNNGLKNRTGMLEGLEKQGILEKKKTFEKKWMQWVEQEPARKKKYGNILTEIDNFIQQNADFYRKDQRLSILVGRRRGQALLRQAHLVYRIVEERQKPDIKRESGFQERDMFRLKTRVELAERRYDPEVDKAYFKYRLKKLLKQPRSQCPKALIHVLEKGPEGIDKHVDGLYAATILKDPKRRLELIQLKPAARLKLNDPFINLAADLEKELNVSREKKKILDQQKSDLKKVYMASLLEMHKGKIAPDANSSIRFTYGPVKEYHPRDAVTYLPITTLKGVMQKETGKYPFEVPEKLKKLYQARDFGQYMDKNLEDIPTCFLNTTNVTGGNSGSPTLNANGEQVGIVFDMTYESVIGDYYIIPVLQRTISVDIRYVLFITDKFANAHHLLKEMKIR